MDWNNDYVLKVKMKNILRDVMIFLSLISLGTFDMDFEVKLMEAGLEISERHSEIFDNLLERKTKGIKRRTKRAYWGFDRFFDDAIRAKNHFGKLKDTIGSYIEEQNKKVSIVFFLQF